MHNEYVMSSSENNLIRWAQKDQRPGITLGQLVALLELSGRNSVADIADGSARDAVNYRQKLDRLEKALGIGRLTQRNGTVTQVTELGRRVAGETRLLLMELSKGARLSAQKQTWVFGAGDTWLQSVVVPTLARWPKTAAAARWQVANLRSHAVCDSLSDGRIHFGLLRRTDMPAEHGLRVLKTYPGVGYSLVISGAGRRFDGPTDALKWIQDERHPFIQQGTTWLGLAKAFVSDGLGHALEEMEPDVVCETHPQAANSVANGRGWTVVPSVVARHIDRQDVQILAVTRSKPVDEVAFIANVRVLEKLSGAVAAADALKHELGLTISGAKR